MPTIPYAAQTWTDGSSDVSAARMLVIENGIKEVSLAPAARVFHNANQSITNNTWTSLAFNSERYDQAGGSADTQHDTVTNNSRLTCRYAGVYQITGTAAFAANSTGVRYIRIFHQGTTIISPVQINFTPGGADATILNVTTDWLMAVNEYVELQVFQTSGAGLNVLNAASYSPEFMWKRVA